MHIDAEIEVPTLGKIKVDVAWGGMFYTIIDVRQFEGLKLVHEMGKEIARVSALCTKAAKDQLPVSHPDYPGVGRSISELHGPSDNPNVDWKSVNTMFTKEIDLNNPETSNTYHCTNTCKNISTVVTLSDLELSYEKNLFL